MPDYTEKYHLKKPKPEEFADIADLNGNADIIDEILKGKADLDAEGKIPAEQMPASAIPIVTTEGTGEAYTAQVPGITELKPGMLLTIIPHTTSTTADATLDVNGLGPVRLRRYISTNTLGTAAANLANWLRADKAVLVVYNTGTWTVLGLTKAAATDLSGIMPVDKGGTGRSTWAPHRLLCTTDSGGITQTEVPPGEASVLMQDQTGAPYWGTPEDIRQAVGAIVPSQSGMLTYNGGEQSPTWNNFDPNTLEIGGVTIGTDSGTYVATFTPKAGFKWSDGTTETKSVPWSIRKAAQAISAGTEDMTAGTTELATGQIYLQYE